MINTPDKSEMTTDNEQTPSKEELLNNLQKDTREFSWELKFAGLEYDIKRDIVDDVVDGIVNLLHKEKFSRWNVFMNLLMEIIKNCADHSESNGDIQLQIIKDTQNKRLSIHFLITDEGPGFPFSEDEIIGIFNAGGVKEENRKKKGNRNYGVGFSIIDGVMRHLNVDLLLHNKGNIIHLNDLGLQKNAKTSDKFGYEGVGIFDMIID